MEALLVSQTQLANSNLRTGLQTISKGLDEVYLFNDTGAVAIILEEAEIMLGPHLEAVSPKHAGQIWGFISKFVMLDCFSQVLGAVEVHPGLPVLRKICTLHYLGTGVKVTCFTEST